MSIRLHNAPTIALPHLPEDVRPPTGNGTNYPFGIFDLSNAEARKKFALFDALAGRVYKWTVAVTVEYHELTATETPGQEPCAANAESHTSEVWINHTGTAVMVATAFLRNARQVVVANEAVGQSNPPATTFYWTNPNGADTDFTPDAGLETALANVNGAFSGVGTIDESFLAHPGTLLASGVGGYTDKTHDNHVVTHDDYWHDAGGGCVNDATDTDESDIETFNHLASMSVLYNDAAAVGEGEPDVPFRHYYAHSFTRPEDGATREVGYLAFLFHAYFARDDIGHHEVLFEASTHRDSLPISWADPSVVPGGQDGAVGTFTIQWPDPITNETLSLSCPIYGWHMVGENTSVDYTINVTMTPAACMPYDSIYNDDGTSNEGPLNG